MTVQPSQNADVAIAARNISKTFQIHTAAATSLKEVVVRGFVTHRKTTVFDALKDVSFQVRRGGSIAIVGSNGSGKSTLLKLISGISQPNSGTLEISGRIAALLELGAGFHPELTGMENIFLQGSILGLSRKQILDRLGNVLEFCELGKFIHTPMKRYSSGMTIRLGFALAVFSDAEILLIDEVLAVGDSAFQTKCLRKIAELRRQGKTIIFVSHQVQHVELVADEILWLEKGAVLAQGQLDEILPQYLLALSGGAPQPAEASEELDINNPRHRLLMSTNPQGSRAVPRGALIEEVEFLGNEGQPRQMFLPGETMLVDVRFSVLEELERLDVQLGYAGFGELRLGWQSAHMQGLGLGYLKPGRHKVRARVELPFKPGRYRITVGLVKSLKTFDLYDVHTESYTIQIRGAIEPDDIATVRPPGRFRTAKRNL